MTEEPELANRFAQLGLEKGSADYEYSALPTPTSIRLLRVEDRRSKPIKCSLRTVDLRDKPHYCCLSYTWGNPHANGTHFEAHYEAAAAEYEPSNVWPISCNGKLLHVGKNLYDALCELPLDGSAERSHNSKDSAGKLLHLVHGTEIWIDALCINQEDIEERSAQIQLMDKVFNGAKLVIIWLGREDEHTGRIGGVLSKLASATGKLQGSDIEPYHEKEPVEKYQRAGLEYISWEEWISLAALYLRQCFRRLWIFQEIILAEEILIFCGRHSISWADLTKVTKEVRGRSKIMKYPALAVFIPPGSVAMAIEDPVMQLAAWREQRFRDAGISTTEQQEGEDANAMLPLNTTLLTLVEDTWTFHATDPRDHIFGLWGLYKLYHPQSTSRLLSYSKPAEECYAYATKLMIEECQNFKMVLTVQDRSVRKINRYPTWIPDFSLHFMNQMTTIFDVGGEASPEDYQQAGVSWDKLNVRGMEFDRVVQVADDPLHRRAPPYDLNQSWFDMVPEVYHPYFTGQSSTEALWRTLCADQDIAGLHFPAPDYYGELFREMICTMLCCQAVREALEDVDPPRAPGDYLAYCMSRALEVYKSPPMTELTNDELLCIMGQVDSVFRKPEWRGLRHTLFKLHCLSVEDPNAFTPSLDQLHEHAKNKWWYNKDRPYAVPKPADISFVYAYQRKAGGRRLFLTEKNYLGLGPKSMKIGDSVWIIRGMGGLAVLRKPGERAPIDSELRSAESHFEYIGDAYVHGIMHGDRADKIEPEFKDIVLI